MKNTAFLFSLLLSFGLRAQDFYGTGVQEVKIGLPYQRWDQQLDSLKKANPDARAHGLVWVNGLKLDSVGVRYKGNSSYFKTRKDTYKKLPLNIKLDYKKRNQQLKGGHRTIKLSNGFLDPSFVREPLGYEVARKYMPAPLCNFANVYINNKYYGLYVNSESVDASFISKHFGTTTGDLVKCDPDNWKKTRSQNGCPKGENASLVYLNESPGCYEAFYEVENERAWKPLLNLIRVLNRTPDQIETVLDVDQTLWMLAFNNVMVNLDSYNGSLSHNYYLWFDTTGVAHPILWDLNMCFGGWRRNFSFEEMKEEELIKYQPLTEIDNVKRPLISKILRNNTYRKIYLAHVRTITNDWLTNNQLMTRAQAMQKEIEPWVKLDSLKLYSQKDFSNSLDSTLTYAPDHLIGLRQLMAKRTEWLAKHPLLNKVQPVIAEVKHFKEAEKLRVTAKLTGATKGGTLYFRRDKSFAFSHIPMTDDGTNGDLKAGDGIFTALVEKSKVKHYYVAAENEEAAAVFPERASYEFLKVE